MRTFARVFALVAVALLAAGPVWAGPLLTGSSATLSAPAPTSAPAPSALDLLYLAPIAFGITIRKSIGDIAAKFSTRASGATKDYTDGVAGAGQEWEARTRESEDAWIQGTQEAIADRRFGKGVSEAGAAKYQTNAAKLGPGRFAEGVRNALDAYGRGMAPYLDVLRSLTLPAKGPRRSPQNRDRAQAVALALGNRKIGK